MSISFQSVVSLSPFLSVHTLLVDFSGVDAFAGTYSGLLDCTVKSFRQEGIVVFFRGISAALVRAFPLHGAVFVGYETCMKLLNTLA